MSRDIIYEERGHVRLITIDRPSRMNSLDFAANEALVEAWLRFAEGTTAFRDKRDANFRGQ